MTGTEEGTAAGQQDDPTSQADDSTRPSRRGRGAVLTLAAVAIVAVLAIGAAVVLGGDDDGGDDDGGAETEAAPAPEAWDERVAPIADWVEAERE